MTRYQNEQYDCIIVTPTYDPSPATVTFHLPRGLEEPLRSLCKERMEADGVILREQVEVDEGVQKLMSLYPNCYYGGYVDREVDFQIISPSGDRGFCASNIRGDSPEDLRMLEILSTVESKEDLTAELEEWMFNKEISGYATDRGLVYDYDLMKLCDCNEVYLRSRTSISWANLREGASRILAVIRGETVEE